MDLVCGTDFSTEARRGAEIAGSLASRFGGSLQLVHALQLPTIAYVGGDVVLLSPSADDRRRSMGDADRLIAMEASRLADLTGARVEGQLDIASAEEAVLDAVTRTKAGLAVVGTRGHRAPVRWILGSTAQHLAAACPVPLLVARGETRAFLEWARGARALRVMVCADFEESLVPAAAFVAALEQAGRTDIHVAHACEIPVEPVLPTPYPFVPPAPVPRAEAEANIRTELRRHAESAGLTHSADSLHVVWGRAAPALARFARDGAFDLVVAGTHGRRGLERALLGSVANGLLHRLDRPLLIAPFPAA